MTHKASDNQNNGAKKEYSGKYNVLSLILSLGAIIVSVYAVNVTKVSSERSTRAYLGVISDGPPLLGSYPTKAPIRIINYGNTPAYDLSYGGLPFHERPEKHRVEYNWTFRLAPPSLGYLPKEIPITLWRERL
jgi:hypothetical protein